MAITVAKKITCNDYETTYFFNSPINLRKLSLKLLVEKDPVDKWIIKKTSCEPNLKKIVKIEKAVVGTKIIFRLISYTVSVSVKNMEKRFKNR